VSKRSDEMAESAWDDAEPAATQPTPEPGPQHAEREPDPLTGDERDLMATLLWVDVTMPQDLPIALSEDAHDHNLIAWQQAVEPNKAGYVLTNAGRMCLEKLLSKARRQAEPPTPEAEWSEPVSQMSWQRCYNVALSLGYVIYTQHHASHWQAVARGIDDAATCHRSSASTDETAARAVLAITARLNGRYGDTSDRIRLDGLEVHQ
jgi:hypothetical protein